jgi:RimJ/RimL family protein N-acetyltransferase
MDDVAIVTERMSLTPLLAADAPEVFRYRTDPEVCRYQSWVPASVDEVARFIDGLRSVTFDTPDAWLQLGVRLRDTGTLVGDVGVRSPSAMPHQAEIGVTVAPEYQRRGVATEAVSGALGHLFGRLGKHRVFASVDPRNRPSVALLERVGMRREAHFIESLWFKGEWVDDLVFAILASEWRGR